MADKSEYRAMTKGNEKKLEGLPVDSSPYTQYKDLEDYKQQGYGTQGHLQPQQARGAASSVDAPTEAGGETPLIAQIATTNVINRHGGS